MVIYMWTAPFFIFGIRGGSGWARSLLLGSSSFFSYKAVLNPAVSGCRVRGRSPWLGLSLVLKLLTFFYPLTLVKYPSLSNHVIQR